MFDALKELVLLVTLEENNKQHKKEIENLKNQYEYLLKEKEQQLEKFVEEFKQYHAQK